MTPFGFGAGVSKSRQSLSTAAKSGQVHGSRSVSPAYHDAARVFQIASNLYLRRSVYQLLEPIFLSEKFSMFCMALKTLGNICSMPMCDQKFLKRKVIQGLVRKWICFYK